MRTLCRLVAAVAFAGVPLISCGPAVVPSPVVPAAAVPSAPPPRPVAVDVAPLAANVAPLATLAPPVMAKFVEVTSAGVSVPVGSRCDLLYIAVAKGAATVAGLAIAAGDVAEVSHFAAPGSLDVKGSGLAIVVTVLHACSGAEEATGPLAIHVARAGDAKDLSWAGGAMHAHLDLEKESSPELYVGRIEGTAPVAEHDHPTSWEVLCAVEASGTFTLDGIPKHVGGPVVIAVPPGRKHSWQPDPGTKLVAVQLYAPPGPEQRFKTLAAK